MTLPTPLERAPEAIAAGRTVYLKREDLHELGAFKWRGALPALESYREKGSRGVVTASTGNHGAATAWAGRRLGLSAVVFVPKGASQAKVDLIRSLGAEVREAGADFDRAKQQARRFARECGLPFFEDGDEPAQYAGYGAIASEILEQCPEEPAAVIVPIGNGALIGGIGEVLRRGAPGTRLVGAVAKEAPVMELSFRAGRAVPCDRMATFADGLAVRVAIPRAVEVLSRVVDRMELVSEREMARAVGLYAAAGIRVEAAAAAALAVLPRLSAIAGAVVLLVTGRNIDEQLYRRAVERPESFTA
ncbi:MAG: threonine ammonia-lyase [Thermoanaerobaculia bacterium]